MNSVTLNRKQMHQLREIVDRFIDTENFTIESESFVASLDNKKTFFALNGCNKSHFLSGLD